MSPEDTGQPIRIVYVIDNTSFRGGERTFLQLATGLDRGRYDLAVACSPDGPFVERLERIGVPVIPAAMRRKHRLDIVLRLAGEFRRRRPHIVHTQGRGDPFGRLAAWLARVPAVVSTPAAIAGRYLVKEAWRKALYRLIDVTTDRLVDRYIVVNGASVGVLTDRHRVPASRITVIPNGIELERYDPARAARGAWRAGPGIPNDAFLLGALGRLTWEKGFADLIRAFPPLAEKGVWLVIGGEGPQRGELAALAQALDIEDRCLLAGFVEDVPGVLADIDLFVLPSHIEGHPMVLLEAMAMARPIVATAIPGVRDTIADGVDGRLVPLGNGRALTRAIATLCDDRAGARRLGRNARKKVKLEYTVERMVRRTAALYDELLAEKGLADS